jgi:hypothetical protein
MGLILLAIVCLGCATYIFYVLHKSKASPEETERLRQALIEMHKNGLIE